MITYGVCMIEHKCCVQTRGKVMCWAITAFGTDCSGVTLGALSTVNRWYHLVVDMNASAMLPRGAAVVGAIYGLNSG